MSVNKLPNSGHSSQRMQLNLNSNRSLNKSDSKSSMDKPHTSRILSNTTSQANLKSPDVNRTDFYVKLKHLCTSIHEFQNFSKTVYGKHMFEDELEKTFPTPESTPRNKKNDNVDDPKRLDGLHPLMNNPKYLGLLKPEGTTVDAKGQILIPEVLNR
jgi:hypothetical protein